MILMTGSSSGRRQCRVHQIFDVIALCAGDDATMLIVLVQHHQGRTAGDV